MERDSVRLILHFLHFYGKKGGKKLSLRNVCLQNSKILKTLPAYKLKQFLSCIVELIEKHRSKQSMSFGGE